MDMDETMIHDPVLGVNIFMPIITGTQTRVTDMQSEYITNLADIMLTYDNVSDKCSSCFAGNK